MKWNYVDKVGNPTKKGVYWTTLIYPEWRDRERTGRILASVGKRSFSEAGEAPESWVMEGQPKEGLVWTETFGSVKGEKVYAWMPVDEVDIAKLPDGVILDTHEV